MIIEQKENYFLAWMETPVFTEADREKLLAFGGEELEDEIQDLLAEAEKIAAPRVLYTVAAVEKTDGAVLVNGVAIDTPLVVEKLGEKKRCFPYIATCGPELESWSQQFQGDMLLEFWADEVKKLALTRVLAPFFKYVRETYRTGGHLTALNPGSLQGWPLPGQAELFRTLGGNDFVREQTGVVYTGSFLMLPAKTTSGIAFESEHFYENCQYCPIDNCPNRRAQRLDSVEPRR